MNKLLWFDVGVVASLSLQDGHYPYYHSDSDFTGITVNYKSIPENRCESECIQTLQ